MKPIAFINEEDGLVCAKCYKPFTKELSDEEIKAIELQISEGVACYDDFDFVAFARAILKKASEK